MAASMPEEFRKLAEAEMRNRPVAAREWGKEIAWECERRGLRSPVRVPVKKP